jgi:hypothetical protein
LRGRTIAASIARGPSVRINQPEQRPFWIALSVGHGGGFGHDDLGANSSPLVDDFQRVTAQNLRNALLCHGRAQSNKDQRENREVDNRERNARR